MKPSLNAVAVGTALPGTTVGAAPALAVTWHDGKPFADARQMHLGPADWPIEREPSAPAGSLMSQG
jgi:hypothetical protein